MIIEAALSKVSLSALSKSVKSAACIIGKQVLERSTKEALDKALAPAFASNPANFSLLQQSMFALDLSEDSMTELEKFLLSTSFEQFVRASLLLAPSHKEAFEDQIDSLNIYLQRIIPDRSIASTRSLSEAMIGYLEEVVPSAQGVATKLGLLAPTWTAEPAIQNWVADEISSTKKQIDQCGELSASSLREVDIFVERYKRGVRFATSKLKPQSLHESPAIPIETLYVEPEVMHLGNKYKKSCQRDAVIASARRSVLLGNPGGGKSTLAAKLCFDVCSGTLSDRGTDAPELAAMVVLRDYAQHQKVHPCSIVEYLEIQSRKELQIEAPPSSFKLLLLSGRILIIFDGLDELIDTADRMTVRSAVQHFAFEYPVASILVTSREVGYEQAPLDKDSFTHFKLSPFGDSQVAEYTKRWFEYSCGPNREEAERLSRSFVNESSIVPDIRSNPLMLGLLCNLYRQDGFIPKNRPDVYQRCADLLFTKWDRGRGIHIRLPLEHRLKPAMSYLAHWIYSDEELQVGVTESRLVSVTAQYLREWVEDDAEAEGIALDFINFFSGRAWVFTDVGSDQMQRLYQFTHRTFLEYFTADELVRRFARPEDLHNHLIGRVRTRGWDVVCQLSYQLSAQRVLSEDTFIELLLRDAKDCPLAEKLSVLSFLARTMDLLYPKPIARREAVKRCLLAVLENLESIQAEADGNNNRTLAIEILGAVLGTVSETQKINASEVQATLLSIINSPSLSTEGKVLSLVLADDLSVAYQSSQTGQADVKKSVFWSQESDALAVMTRAVRDSLAEVDERIALHSWWRQELSTEAIVANFGPQCCFVSVHFPLSSWFRTAMAKGVIEICLRRYKDDAEELKEINKLRRKWIYDESTIMGAALAAKDSWERKSNEPFLLDSLSYLKRLHEDGTLEWPVDVSVSESILICMAVTSEYEHEDMQKEDVNLGTYGDLVCFYYCRYYDECKERAHQLVIERCSSYKVIEKLHAWIENEFSFTFLPDDITG